MFSTPLRAQKIGVKDGRAEWLLLEDLVYRSDALKRTIVVPAGFITDYASVPRLPLMFLLVGDSAHEAAVVHDYLYKIAPGGIDRGTADDVFLEAMAAIGESWWKRQLMYSGVRAGGWVPWNRYRKEETDGAVSR